MGNQDVKAFASNPKTHPPVKEDDYRLGVHYDSGSEPEALARDFEQPRACVGYADLEKAKADKHDLPTIPQVWDTHDDLLTPVRKSGDPPR